MSADSNSVRPSWGRAVVAAARILAKAEARLATSRSSKAREILALRREIARLEAENDLLRVRLRKIPGRNRSRYSAEQRFRILWHRQRYRLSMRKTAKIFVFGDTAGPHVAAAFPIRTPLAHRRRRATIGARDATVAPTPRACRPGSPPSSPHGASFPWNRTPASPRRVESRSFQLAGRSFVEEARGE